MAKGMERKRNAWEMSGLGCSEQSRVRVEKKHRCGIHLLTPCNQLESLPHKLLANIRQHAQQVIEAERHISRFTVALLASFGGEDGNEAYGVLTYHLPYNRNSTIVNSSLTS